MGDGPRGVVLACCGCLAVDLKGDGQSDKRSGDYRQGGVAEQLGALLDALGIGEFTLITHDRGSPVGDQAITTVSDRQAGTVIGTCGTPRHDPARLNAHRSTRRIRAVEVRKERQRLDAQAVGCVGGHAE
ncbi:hypothetical protein F0Q45_00330 [Mycobacterium simiae]|uniref:AB hydrolase-1 domain-containing protein n=1 Tax=Mycobacterium simiae TaxID=1784 RepID=A0A5B1BVY2_MYCSI|nr:alpha/beta hydrolase [Mycobacterium simiae]KAA1252171.1 hypothetical protein F0Q45_00330 [Mycobacterium simiae]